MKYFDFHTHILFKQIFDENPNIDSRISRTDVSGVPRLCSDLPNIIQSQIHQSQLAEYGDEVICGVVLYGLERHLAREVIPLRQYLNGASQHKLSEQLLKDVAENKYKAFSQFTMERTLNEYLNATASFNILDANSFNARCQRIRSIFSLWWKGVILLLTPGINIYRRMNLSLSRKFSIISISF
jgi:hypothetical protein